jgi:hypothetical protein
MPAGKGSWGMHADWLLWRARGRVVLAAAEGNATGAGPAGSRNREIRCSLQRGRLLRCCGMGCELKHATRRGRHLPGKLEGLVLLR